MKKIRFGIISCGMIAHFHAMSILDDGRAELAAVCGHSSIEKTREFAGKYGARKVYMDYRELAADKDIDAVCVCSPSGLHGIHAIECMKKGKHVLCEKPLDIKSEVMAEMIDTARDNKVKLGCVFPNRTRSGLRKAKEIIDKGILGKMTIVECQYRGYRPPEYFTSSKWKGTKALDGGGCLMNQGIHAIDTMCWLTGDVKSVYGISRAMLRDIEVEDTAMAILEFANGAYGVLMGTTISNVPENAPEGDRLRIEFEKGTILYAEGRTYLYTRKSMISNEEIASITGRRSQDIQGDDEVQKTLLDGEEGEVVSSSSDPSNVDIKSHSFIVSDFISAVLEDRAPYIPGDSAKKCVDLVLAVYKSSETGKKIDV
ncbi:MAG: Gfo/Idh/MocA family oxidoreductase [Clostridiaceae bacterium]|nr:Gfo/Idh/MocA family oxidoreductase [Clostridiaceae bacterium]